MWFIITQPNLKHVVELGSLKVQTWVYGVLKSACMSHHVHQDWGPVLKNMKAMV
jgi:hypothetical protein